MDKENSFLSQCTSGGCGAKIGPGELSDILKTITPFESDRLIIGYDTSDDAAVYKIDEKRGVISTVDFFSPMVEDPYLFGEIAAANALSDVYAMGGTPAFVLNLICFPEHLDKNILEKILQGGASKTKEAGAVLAGGHSIYDKEAKYGLAVTGFIDLDKIIRNNTPQVGDKLILTKPLGLGIVMAAARVDLATENSITRAHYTMARLNKYAAEKIDADSRVSACTDITGFGLLAHLLEMCGDRVTGLVDPNALPILPDAAAYAEEYILTAAGQRNRNFFEEKGRVDQLPFSIQELLFDPQTSGGLLISVHPDSADTLLTSIQVDDPDAGIIGEIIPREKENILFKEWL